MFQISDIENKRKPKCRFACPTQPDSGLPLRIRTAESGIPLPRASHPPAAPERAARRRRTLPDDGKRTNFATGCDPARRAEALRRNRHRTQKPDSHINR